MANKYRRRVGNFIKKMMLDPTECGDEYKIRQPNLFD